MKSAFPALLIAAFAWVMVAHASSTKPPSAAGSHSDVLSWLLPGAPGTVKTVVLGYDPQTKRSKRIDSADPAENVCLIRQALAVRDGLYRLGVPNQTQFLKARNSGMTIFLIDGRGGGRPTAGAASEPKLAVVPKTRAKTQLILVSPQIAADGTCELLSPESIEAGLKGEVNEMTSGVSQLEVDRAAVEGLLKDFGQITLQDPQKDPRQFGENQKTIAPREIGSSAPNPASGTTGGVSIDALP